MKSSDLAHFGVKFPPFSKEIDDGDLWLPSSKLELVDELSEPILFTASPMRTRETELSNAA
jgi:hypothetical protein